MKKILSILLAMCMLFAMFALPAVAEGETGYYIHFGDQVTFVEGTAGDTIVLPLYLTEAAAMGKHHIGWCTDEAFENPLTADPTVSAGTPAHYYAWLKDFTTYFRTDFDTVTKNDNVYQYTDDTWKDNAKYHGYVFPLYGTTCATGTDVFSSYWNSASYTGHSMLHLKDNNGAYVGAAPNTTYNISFKYRVIDATDTTEVTIRSKYGIHVRFAEWKGGTNNNTYSDTMVKSFANLTKVTGNKDWTEYSGDITTGADLQLNAGDPYGYLDTYIPTLGLDLYHGKGTARVQFDYLTIQTYKTIKFDLIDGEDSVVEGKLYGDVIEYPELANGSKWSLDPDKYVEAPATVGEDSVTLYEYNENAATRYPVNFVYANGDVVTEQYVEGATIVYPELAPAAYNLTDNVWSGSATALTAVPTEMGAEEVTVYEYQNPVMSFENYNTGYWPSGKAPNNAHISTERAYSGTHSMKISGLNVIPVTSEPSDWATNWKAYYTYDAESDKMVAVAGDTAPNFADGEYYMYGRDTAGLPQESFILPVEIGPGFNGTQALSYSYKYKITFKYYLESGSRDVWMKVKQVNLGSKWFNVSEVGGNYRTAGQLGKNAWKEFTIEVEAENLAGAAGQWGQLALVMQVYDGWTTGEKVNQTSLKMYIDDVKVEPVIEEVNVNLNRYTTAGNEVETLTGKPGDALTLPATNFFMDENWYTADGEVYTGTVFPEEELNLYTAGEFVDDEDSTTIGANFDVVKDGSDYVIHYAGTDAQVTGKDNALAIGTVEDYKTYKVAVTYKANGGNLGFNAYTAQADNMYLGTMPVNGAYTGNIYAVTETTNGEYTTAVFYISTDLYGEYTAVAGKEDTKTAVADQLYLTVQDTGASELFIKDIAVTAVDGIAADGAAKLTEDDAETEGAQAIRFFFNYKYEIANEKIYVVLGDDKYELVGRGFAYMNGNDQAIGVDNAFTLNSAYENMVISYKDTDLNQCWSFTADEMTFSTYVRGITDELADDEIMIKGFVKVLVDGQEMVIYSNTISRSVAGVESYI